MDAGRYENYINMEKTPKNILSRKSREHLSWQLIVSAYFIEVCLIMISVITAVNLTDTSDSSVFLVSSVSLAVLLSIVEPLKILAAQSLVILSTLTGRFLATALLLFATAISFENISQTVKMAQKNLTFPIDISANKIVDYQNQLKNLKKEVSEHSKKMPPSYQIQKIELSANKAEIKNLQNQIQNIKENNNRFEINSIKDSINSIKENIASANLRQDNLQTDCFDRKEKILKLMNDSVNERLFGRAATKDMYRSDIDSLQQECKSQLQNIKVIISNHNIQITKLLEDKQKLFKLSNSNLAEIDILSSKISDLESINKKINERAFQNNKDVNSFEVKKAKDLATAAKSIKSIESSLIRETKNINELKANSILYAVAATFYRIPSDKITTEQFEFFLTIWLLVLSIGLCLIPPVLAIIGEVIVVESDKESLFGSVLSYIKDKRAIREDKRAIREKVESEVSSDLLKKDKIIDQKNQKIENLEDKLSKKDSETHRLKNEVDQLEQNQSKYTDERYHLTRENKVKEVEIEALKKELEFAKKDVQKHKKQKTIIPVPIDSNKGFAKFLSKLDELFTKNKGSSDFEEVKSSENNIKDIWKWKKK